MIAKALPVAIATAVNTINKGVFMATSLLRAPEHKRSEIVHGSK